MLRKLTSLILCFSLFLTQAGLAEVGQTLNLSNYLNSSPRTISPLGFQPPVLRYFSYDVTADNFQLLLDPQDLKDKFSEGETKSLAQEQLNYFLVGLTLPNSKFWVNLRPDAPDNIIEPELEQTEVGRIMLAADLQLKKDTANFTSPQTKEGREYWDKLYQKAKELFGTEPANIPTITRPWIVPGEILIREDKGAAYVYKATLKVMLEEDYLKSPQSTVHSPQYSFKDSRMKEINVYSSQLIRELILPKLTQEVNSGKNYASLRQVYFSLVLSRWFKMRFGKPVSQLASKPVNPLTGKPANLSQLIDRSDLTGLTSKTPWSKETYFKEYQKSFSQGEYNLKEQVATPTGQVIRSYVSGGTNFEFPCPGIAGSPINSFKEKLGDKRGHINSPWLFVSFLSGLAIGGYFLSMEPSVDKPAVQTTVVQSKKINELVEIRNKLNEDGYNYEWVERLLAAVNKLQQGWQGKKEGSTRYYIDGPYPVRTEMTVNKDGGYIISFIKDNDTPNKKMYDVLHYFPDRLDFGQDYFNYLTLHPEYKEFVEIFKKIADSWKVYPSGSSPLTQLEQAKEEIKTAMNTFFKEVTDVFLPLHVSDLEDNKNQYDANKESMYRAIEAAKDASGLLSVLSQFEKEYLLSIKGYLHMLIGMLPDGREKYYEQENKLFNDLDGSLNDIKQKLEGQRSSSAIAVQPQNPRQDPAENVVGGIDFTDIEKYLQYDGSFKGIDLSLPLLSKKELESFDLEKEEQTLRNYLATGFNPNGDRLKRLLAGLFQKDGFSSRQLDLLRLSQNLCNFLSARGLETTPDQRAFILIANTGLYTMRQGSLTKYSPN